MLREDVGTTFSDMWYRVAPTRPKLSVHANVIRQHFGPHISYIVEEPASGQYYRLTASAYLFLGMLDGERTVDEVWEACCEKLGDDAPTQRECVDLLSKLQMFGLLIGDMPLAADMVIERKRQARKMNVRRRTGNWMFFSIPLFNPEPLLERHKHFIKLVFSKAGLLVWTITVLTALVLVARNWRAFGSEMNFSLLIAPHQLPILGLTFLFLRACHEMGHAAACKAMGGRSSEIGVLLIAMILPLPYCDATSAWRFPETWRRVLVSMAGVIVEMFIAAIAAMIWVATGEQAGSIHTVAYQAMLISGVTTIFFNINPLLRYDGYYILSDLLGIPNLAQKSRDLWKYFAERYAFGLRGLKPPAVRGRTETILLAVYGMLSVPYRVFISVSILVLIMSRYAEFGLVLAAFFAVAWLLWPLMKGVGYLVSSPKLLGRRARAFGVVGAVAAVLIIGLGLIPVPAAGYASGTIEARVQAPVRATESGFVTDIHYEAGQHVDKGNVVFKLANAELETDLRVAEARVEGAQAVLAETLATNPTQREVASIQLANLMQARDHARQQVDDLSIVAPAAGSLATREGSGRDIANLEGRFIERGQLLAEITSIDDLVIRASVPDRNFSYIFAPGHAPSVGVRVRGMASKVHPARIIRRVDAGTRQIHNQALATTSGGDIAIDPRDPDAMRSLESRFFVELEPLEPIEGAQPGMRVRVRFGLEPTPVAGQFVRLVRQYLTAKLAS